MEYCYQYNSVSNAEKEKRPPLRRGGVKLQIVKTLSNLVVAPSNGSDSKQADRNSFTRERSYN
ncbi:hypothetical protein Zm00014a_040795 [Zea mays]|jgi:hypothetical protein|nr:uncharacterized protein LOC100277991 [Zea mays]ACG43690.1 hypothetical protein [Zea mays]ACN37110.1 unknown [Zea mays]AQK86568.1 hypothetical protein ZEAMMB73_Zm00001d038403 [Zea mays]PWZ17749.1 hypothetical protein Zm00014a_040795 [Zea mays]